MPGPGHAGHTDAAARCRVVDGKWKCTDLCGAISGTGAANTDKYTIATCIALAITDAETDFCINPAGNAEPPRTKGTPYSYTTLDASVSEVTSADVAARGRFTIVQDPIEEECYSWDDDIWPAVASGLCPSDKWGLDLDSRKLVRFVGYHAAYQEDKKSGLVLRSSAM